MIINVNTEKMKIQNNPDIVLSGEYLIHKCSFNFSEEYDGLTKMCLFTKFGITYEKEIINNECNIPYEVLLKDGPLTIGVYAYEIEYYNIIKRYSPEPIKVNIGIGSYKENVITPIDDVDETLFEEFVREINEKIDKKQDKLIARE